MSRFIRPMTKLAFALLLAVLLLVSGVRADKGEHPAILYALTNIAPAAAGDNGKEAGLSQGRGAVLNRSALP